jgi:hypothetical protein
MSTGITQTEQKEIDCLNREAKFSKRPTYVLKEDRVFESPNGFSPRFTRRQMNSFKQNAKIKKHTLLIYHMKNT